MAGAVVAALLPSGRALGADGSLAPFRPVIETVAADRFGLDSDGDGLIDLANTVEYVHGVEQGRCGVTCPEARFPIMLWGSLGGLDGERLPDPTGLRFEWTVSGAALAEPEIATGPVATVGLPEGSHRVELAVHLELPWGSVAVRTATRLRVDDLLIVAIGDSYSAGEGNPERPLDGDSEAAAWADGVGDASVEATHAAARRSTVAWPARVALALERADTNSSVTFVSVAASGARITDGLLRPQRTVAELGQIEQVARLVGERDIDLLLMSIGGNDVGFSRIIRELVEADRFFDPICYRTDLSNLWASARDGAWNRDSVVRPGLPYGLECRSVILESGASLPGLDGLAGEFDLLAEAIADRLAARRILVTQYPDPTGRQRDGGHDVCGEIVGDVLAPFRFLEIDRREQQAGRTLVIDPLNAVVSDAAHRHGWELVDGIAAAFFQGHGYCAMPPVYGDDAQYRNPGWDLIALDPGDRTTSWFRTASQSVALQGPRVGFETTGTLHPNELGHAAIADLVLEHLGRFSW